MLVWLGVVKFRNSCERRGLNEKLVGCEIHKEHKTQRSPLPMQNRTDSLESCVHQLHSPVNIAVEADSW